MNLTDQQITDKKVALQILKDYRRTHPDKASRLFPEGIPNKERAMANIAKVYNKILQNPGRLNMSDWHCGTSHCLAGWAQVVFDKYYKKGSLSASYLTAGQIGLMTIWPIAHLFYSLSTSEEIILYRIEYLLEQNGYEIRG